MKTHYLFALFFTLFLPYFGFGAYFLYKDYHICRHFNFLWTYTASSLIAGLTIPIFAYFQLSSFSILNVFSQDQDDRKSLLVSLIRIGYYSLLVAIFDFLYGTVIIHSEEITSGKFSFVCGHIKKSALWYVASVSYYFCGVLGIFVLSLFIQNRRYKLREHERMTKNSGAQVIRNILLEEGISLQDPSDMPQQTQTQHQNTTHTQPHPKMHPLTEHNLTQVQSTPHPTNYHAPTPPTHTPPTHTPHQNSHLTNPSPQNHPPPIPHPSSHPPHQTSTYSSAFSSHLTPLPFPPATKRGFINKRGTPHNIFAWKKRYVVLFEGSIRFYKEPLDPPKSSLTTTSSSTHTQYSTHLSTPHLTTIQQPPFGKELKTEILDLQHATFSLSGDMVTLTDVSPTTNSSSSSSMASASTSDTSTSSSSSHHGTLSPSRIGMGNFSSGLTTTFNSSSIVMSLPDPSDREGWLLSLEEHIRYAKERASVLFSQSQHPPPTPHQTNNNNNNNHQHQHLSTPPPKPRRPSMID